MSDITKIMEAYLGMVSERKQTEENECPKCKGEGCDHCDGKGVHEKKLDPVNDKENDKKFDDRKDKDIDNDGDVDSSDEYLHKRRKATDDAIDGGKKPAKEEVDLDEDASNFKSAVLRIKKAKTVKDIEKLEKSFERVYKTGAFTAKELGQLDDMLMTRKTALEESAQVDEESEEEPKKKSPVPPKKDDGEEESEEPAPESDDEEEEKPESDGETKMKQNPKTADKKAEISKIETKEAFEAFWAALVEATQKSAKGETPEDSTTPDTKRAQDIHKGKSDKKIEDMEDDSHKTTFKAGKVTKKASEPK